jgi:TolA-binding protein
MKSSLLLCLSMSVLFCNAQERLLRKAVELQAEGKFDASMELIRRYQGKEPQQPMGYYVEFRWYVDGSNPFYNPDSAFSALEKSRRLHATGENDKKVSGEDEFRDYVTLLPRLPAYRDSLVALCFDFYDRKGTVESYDYFARRFAGFPQSAVAKQKAYRLRYLEAERQNTLFAYRDFIEKYPEAQDVPKAWLGVYRLSYDLTVKRGTIDDYKRYISDYPRSPYVDSAWGRIHQIDFKRVEMLDDIEEYETHLKEYPKTPYRQAATRNIHRLASAKAKRINTPEAYRKFRMTYPDAPQVGEILELEEKSVWHSILVKEDKEALLYYVNEFPKSPNRRDAIVRLARLVYPEFEEINSEEAYLEFIENYPDTEEAMKANVRISELYFKKAVVSYNSNDYSEALTSLDAAISRYPESAEYHYLKGLLHMNMEHVADAVESFSIALQLNPLYAQAYYERGIVYWNMKDRDSEEGVWDENLEKAVADFQSCLRLSVGHGEANLIMAKYHQKYTYDYSKALNHLRKAQVAGVNDGNLVSNIGELEILVENERVANRSAAEEARRRKIEAGRVQAPQPKSPPKKQYIPTETMDMIKRLKKSKE